MNGGEGPLTRAARVERGLAVGRPLGVAVLLGFGPLVPNLGFGWIVALAALILVYSRGLAYAASRGLPATRLNRIGLALDGVVAVLLLFVFSPQRSWDVALAIPAFLIVAGFRGGRDGVTVGFVVMAMADLAVSFYRQQLGFAFELPEILFRVGIYGTTAVLMIALLRQLEELRTVQTTLFEPLTQAQDSLGEAIIIREGDRITTVSDAFTRLSGYDRREVPDLPALMRMIPEDERALVTERIAATTQDRFDMRLRRKDGQVVDVEVARKAMDDAKVVVLVRDITERKRAEQELERSVLRDPLTGLPTAAILRDRIQSALADARRREVSFCVLHIVLPGFKFVTETVGPAGAHQVLFELAGRLRGRMREVDSAARTGADSFGALLADCEDGGGRRVASALAHVLARSYDVPLATGPLRISAAIGIAIGPAHGETADALLRAAEAAAWNAVRNSRESVVYDPESYTAVAG